MDNSHHDFDSDAAVHDVMEYCNCDLKKAVDLLKKSGNDPERAKERYRRLKKYMKSPNLKPQKTPINPEFIPPVPRPLIGPYLAERTGNTSDDNVSSATPITDEDSIHQFEDTISPISLVENRPTTPSPMAGDNSKLHNGSKTSAQPSLGPQSVVKDDRKRPSHKFEPVSNGSELAFGADIAIKPKPLAPEELDEHSDRGDTTEWDFILPKIESPPFVAPGGDAGDSDFSISALVGAVQNGTPSQVIRNYLDGYDRKTVKKHINSPVDGFPAMFFAVATNDENIIRTWVDYGGSVSTVHDLSRVPLLAFAIVHSATIKADTTLAVATLLSLGALPQVIPSAFYTPFCQDLPDGGPSDEDLKDLDNETKKWCTAAVRLRLTRTANLTQRYYLERAANTKPSSTRQRQIAIRKNAEPLLGIPYFLIGQTLAANLLLQKLLSHIMVPSKRPLVLVFAGPSGHGKTELARRLGHLLSLSLQIVDCTIFNREMELFGPRHPYIGAEKGSPLNNFIADNAGQRCIVFMDEFEKTTNDIHKALLLPFDNGEYQDRRHQTTIDCSKTIWILATNALDHTIQEFCKTHHAEFFVSSDQAERQRLSKPLAKQLKENFLTQFGSPLTGRISSFIPFLPFTPSEAATIVHTHLLALEATVARPVSLAPGPSEQLLGNIRLKLRRDATVCRTLADEYYHRELGVRPLIGAVKSVEEQVVEGYLAVEEEIEDGQAAEEMWDAVVAVEGGEVVVRMAPPKQKDKKDME